MAIGEEPTREVLALAESDEAPAVSSSAAANDAAPVAGDETPADDAVPAASDNAGAEDETPAVGDESTAENAPIAANDGPADDDEYELFDGWDAGSSTSASVTSSIYRHSFENGRRFASYESKYGSYPLPNDDMEQNREDIKHAMMLEITGGKLYYAPLRSHPQKVIDIGTGTGIWAIDMADQTPSAEVLGIDLSPIQPQWLPPNCRFLIDDAEEEWLNGDNYDMVHMRTMTSVLKDVPKAMRSSFQCLRKGGWIELQELEAMCYCDDGTMPEDDEVLEFYRLLHKALGRFSMDMAMPTKMHTLLEDAGFVNIQCVVKKIPIGPWAQDRNLRTAGMFLREAVVDLCASMTGKAFPSYGLSEAQCEVMSMGVRKSLKDLRRHRYLNFFFWTAQKPE